MAGKDNGGKKNDSVDGGKLSRGQKGRPTQIAERREMMMQREFVNRSGRRLLRIATAEDEGQLLIGVEDTHAGCFDEIILPADLAPAIAAAVLEAAGYEPAGPVVEPEHSQPSDADWYLRAAANHLACAAAIREYHAKPKVTGAQVDAVSKITDCAGENIYNHHAIREILQAALDSGVLVPADPTNKEDDRGE